MRRHLLLLFAFVLALQTSWAAAHFCDDERLVAQTVAAAEFGHVHEAAGDEQSDLKAQKISDTCCAAAHGCHGLHHLLGQADPEFATRVPTAMPAPSGAAPPLFRPRSRIERPNWLAA